MRTTRWECCWTDEFVPNWSATRLLPYSWVRRRAKRTGISRRSTFPRGCFLSRYPIQSKAKTLHLLAVQTAQRNLHRLPGVQLRRSARMSATAFRCFPLRPCGTRTDSSKHSVCNRSIARGRLRANRCLRAGVLIAGGVRIDPTDHHRSYGNLDWSESHVAGTTHYS